MDFRVVFISYQILIHFRKQTNQLICISKIYHILIDFIPNTLSNFFYIVESNQTLRNLLYSTNFQYIISYYRQAIYFFPKSTLQFFFLCRRTHVIQVGRNTFCDNFFFQKIQKLYLTYVDQLFINLNRTHMTHFGCEFSDWDGTWWAANIHTICRSSHIGFEHRKMRFKSNEIDLKQHWMEKQR